jgi:hypothetical protein
MTEPHKVRRYARVERPYESVRATLHRMVLAGTGAPLVDLHSIDDQQDVAGLPASTRVTLGLLENIGGGSKHLASAEIYASALSARATQIEVECHCVAPEAWASAETSRVAEKHMQALLESVVDRIRREADALAIRTDTRVATATAVAEPERHEIC